MQQEIYEVPYELAAWDLEETSRCFVHLCNALQWREITGANPPQTPVTSKEYEKAGLPWFDYAPISPRAFETLDRPPSVRHSPSK